MAMLLYTLAGYTQLPTPTLITPPGLTQPDHAILTEPRDEFAPRIAIDKVHPPNILISFGATSSVFTSQSNYQGYYYSPDGGVTVTGSLDMPNSANSDGNPSVCFDANGIGYMMGQNSNQSGFLNVTTSDDGADWAGTTNNRVVTSSPWCFGPMGIADDMSTSPYTNNYYSVWVDNSSSPSVIKTSKSSDGGATFTNEVQLCRIQAAGPNIQTGESGQVYVCWSTFLSPPGYTNVIFHMMDP